MRLFLSFLPLTTTAFLQYTTKPNKSNKKLKSNEPKITYRSALNNSNTNWIERADPLGLDFSTTEKQENSAYFSLKLNGSDYETGSLSAKFNDALLQAAFARMDGNIPDELYPVYKTFAMDLTCQEATKLALSQNGLALVELGQDQLWGEVEDISVDNNEVFGSIQEAVESGKWNPGQNYSFVVRNVAATVLEEESSFSSEVSKISNLEQLQKYQDIRCNAAPLSATPGGFAPWNSPEVIPKQDLSTKNFDGTENEFVTADVMDGLRNHGYIIVDVEDEESESALTGMWDACETFFDFASQNQDFEMPRMEIAPEAGSRFAVVGYQEYDNGSMRFLETRVKRDGNSLVPDILEKVIGKKAVQDCVNANRVLTSIGKDVLRIATTAATVEVEKFTGEAAASASYNAELMATELMDDGCDITGLGSEYLNLLSNGDSFASPISMSPHRLCCYTNKDDDKDAAKEVFGAHTDTTFCTIVPVAAVSGLEIYDFEEGAWVRPELVARRYFEEEQENAGLDPSVQEIERVDKNGVIVKVPWHARFVVIMPGELLQVVSRGSVSASVHRVVAASKGSSRLSVPMLLRARTTANMNNERYFKGSQKLGPLLEYCDGLSLAEVHDQLQPKPKE